MISNETLKKYKEAKKELSKVKGKIRNIEEEISKEIFENIISRNYKIKNKKVDLEGHIEDENATIFYPELEIPDEVEKEETEIYGYSKRFGVGDITLEYTLKDKKNDITIRIIGKSYKANMVPRGIVIDNEIKYYSMVWIEYTVKIGKKKFVYRRDYEKEFIELPVEETKKRFF